MHEAIAKSHPKLERGQVWCTVCSRSESVKAAGALQHGWPKCCGYTMTIDSPAERAPNYRPKGSMCTACKHRDGPCSHLPFHEMPVCNTLADGTKVVICSKFERRNA